MHLEKSRCHAAIPPFLDPATEKPDGLPQKIYSMAGSITIHTMYDLTGFQRDTLYIIGGLENPHGLAIKEELEEYYEQEVHHGRLYPNLDSLVDKGLVDKGEKDRRTNVYNITSRGRREIDAREEWEEQYVPEELQA